MSTGMKPIRRVVTGNDERGRSMIAWDGPAPNVHKSTALTNAWVDFWVWHRTPAPLSGGDDGNLSYDFPGPRSGGHLRAVHGPGRPADYDPAKDAKLKPFHAPVERPAGKTWDRGGRSAYSSDMHKTETVDYAILLEGEHDLVLDDGKIGWRPGDIVIDVAAYHQWTSPRQYGTVLYDMVAARFVDGPVGLAQGNDRVMRAAPDQRLPEGVKPARRIVCLATTGIASNIFQDGRVKCQG